MLGLGVSHRPLVERARGGTYDPPLAAMTAYLDGFAAAARAERGARDARCPSSSPPSARGCCALAAARTDGALRYLVTTRAHRAAPAPRSGPTRSSPSSRPSSLGETRDEYLRRAHEHLNIYTGLDNYRASWRRLGFGDEDFVRGGSERLCDAIVVHGDAEAIGERVAEHLAAGADHVCLQVLGATLIEHHSQEWAALGARLATR